MSNGSGKTSQLSPIMILAWRQNRLHHNRCRGLGKSDRHFWVLIREMMVCLMAWAEERKRLQYALGRNRWTAPQHGQRRRRRKTASARWSKKTGTKPCHQRPAPQQGQREVLQTGQEDGLRQKKSRPSRAISLTSTSTNITKKSTLYRVVVPNMEGAASLVTDSPLYLNNLIQL